ncbi:MAG: hypothetical protein AAF363_11895 [Bacteroidota bacterium]
MRRILLLLNQIYLFFGRWFKVTYGSKIYIYSNALISEDKTFQIQEDLQYFSSNEVDLLKIEKLDWFKKFYFLLTFKPIVILGQGYSNRQRIWLNTYNIDDDLCRVSAWSIHRLYSDIYYFNNEKSILESESKIKWSRLKQRLSSLDTSMVLGTGPSLISAVDYDFKQDKIIIACNTIVKSDKLWAKLRPNIIVAGDAIHHFSNTKYASSFRKDCYKRLENDDKLVFCYPHIFHPFVLKEFYPLKNQLLPLFNRNERNPFMNFKRDLPTAAPNHNVLTMLLLPIAANISKKVYFIGFDGRKEGDEGFWESSNEYNYIEYMEELRNSYPGFFDFYVNNPKDKNEYVKNVHGDQLNEWMNNAENSGMYLESLTPSHTATFQKRYKGAIIPQRK